jgi:hypothetical protein
MALGMALAAQSPSPQSSASTETVTVTGCVQPRATGSSPADVAATAATAGSQFMLMNPVVGSTAGPAGATSGVSATPSTSNPAAPAPAPGQTATPPSPMPPPPTAPTTTPPSTTPPSTPATGEAPSAGERPTGTTGAIAAPTQYRLTGGQDLQQFANQLVEIRGTFEDDIAGGTGRTTSPAGTSATAAPDSAQPPVRTLHITSVRLLGGSCPAQPR